MADKKLPTQPYKGVRDFYPEDMYIQKYLFEGMRDVVESFGYEEYDASPLEPTELYEAKTGEEIVNEQMYSFEDRGERRVSLRPEMTPSAARMVAKRRTDLSYPLRWYSIPNLFRYESPQRGRLREHYQLNVDIFGVEGIQAEIELIEISRALMHYFGAVDEQFVIKINNRKILNDLYERFDLSDEDAHDLSKVLDKKDKIASDAFYQAVEYILGGKTQEFVDLIHSSPTLIEKLSEESEGVREIVDLINQLEALGIENIQFDPALTRGFDYYTGIVFELFDTSGENPRSLFGGGRYSNLMKIFGKEHLEAAGFGMGDVTLRDFLETHDLLPDYVTTTDLFLCRVDDTTSVTTYTHSLAHRLRQQGINVAVDLSSKKVGDQIKAADRKHIPFVICIGEHEAESGELTMKELATGEETGLTEENVAGHILGFDE